MNWEALKQRASLTVHQTLGEDVTYHYGEIENQLLRGVFTMIPVQVQMGEVFIDSMRPACSVLRCDVKRKPKQGDMITRRDVTYEVEQVQPTLDASFHLLLHAVDARYAQQTRDRT
jgi:hypothetical protein